MAVFISLFQFKLGGCFPSLLGLGRSPFSQALPLTTYGYRLCRRYRYKQDLAGLAFFYGGLVRDTNIVNTMMMSIISMGLTTITWLVFGFSWSFDEWGAGKGFTYVGFRNLDMVS